MSINEQLAAYRAKKAAQKQAEEGEKQSIFGKTFAKLRTVGDRTEIENSKNDCSSENLSENPDQHQSNAPTEPLHPPRRTHSSELNPPQAQHQNIVSRFLTNDRFIFTRPSILKCLLWLILWGLFIELQFGSVFFVVSLLYIVYTSMESGTRDKNKPSAYSVFNENCERIDGTFTAEQFEKELRYGAGSVH